MVFPINCPYCGETAKRSAAGYYCPACGAKERPVQYVTTTNSTAAPPLVVDGRPPWRILKPISER